MTNGEKYSALIMKHYEEGNDYCRFVENKTLKPLGFCCKRLSCYQCNKKNGMVYAWEAGETSWSTDDEGDYIDWEYAKLVEN